MKYWEAQLKNGEWVNENEHKWEDVKKDVIFLQLHLDNQTISLPKYASDYIQGKTASANLMTGKVEIESRYIAAIFRTITDITIQIRVNEQTNNIVIEKSGIR